MKNLILFSFLLMLVSCGDEEIIEINSTPCTEIEYKVEFDLSLNEEICFPDGNSLILTDVKHQLCPCDVVCETEGDLLVVLKTVTISDNYTYESNKEFNTREVFNDSEIFTDYEITAFSYTYNNDEEVPACAADFEPEKMNLKFVISAK